VGLFGEEADCRREVFRQRWRQSRDSGFVDHPEQKARITLQEVPGLLSRHWRVGRVILGLEVTRAKKHSRDAGTNYY